MLYSMRAGVHAPDGSVGTTLIGLIDTCADAAPCHSSSPRTNSSNSFNWIFTYRSPSLFRAARRPGLRLEQGPRLRDKRQPSAVAPAPNPPWLSNTLQPTHPVSPPAPEPARPPRTQRLEIGLGARGVAWKYDRP